MKRTRKVRDPDSFNDDVERKFQIYNRPYINFVELGFILDVSPQTARKLFDEVNAEEIKIRRYPRIGMPMIDIVKAFGLENNRKQITTLRTAMR